MGAPLTIEQMILNHNIGVSITDAETLGGLSPSSFAPAVHYHDAGDLRTGKVDPSLLPIGTDTAKGIVQLSSSISSTATDIAATPKAVNAVKLMAEAKADTGHKHSPGDVNAGTFTNVLIATATDELGKKQIRNIILGTAVPTSAVGADGDVYFQFE
jgi:hypothetical protein